MKTTIEIDEKKLEHLMTVTGLKTRKDAVDWALTEAGRIAAINRVAETPWDAAFLKDAVEPDYDIVRIRHESSQYKK